MDAEYGTKPKAEISEVDGIILGMIKQGATNTEIAQSVHFSTASVKGRVRRLMRSFGARNRVELAAKASRVDVLGEQLFSQSLTAAEMAFLSWFGELPSETRAIMVQVYRAMLPTEPGGSKDR